MRETANRYFAQFISYLQNKRPRTRVTEMMRDNQHHQSFGGSSIIVHLNAKLVFSYDYSIVVSTEG
jgi:hypothetical protein